MREPGPPGWRSLGWDSKVWLRVLSDSDHWVTTLQLADPSSCQRGRPTEPRPQISESNIPNGSNIWSQVPQGCSIPRHTDWQAVSRNVTSTSMYIGLDVKIAILSLFVFMIAVGSILLLAQLVCNSVVCPRLCLYSSSICGKSPGSHKFIYPCKLRVHMHEGKVINTLKL
jgi:hypothetical protein